MRNSYRIVKRWGLLTLIATCSLANTGCAWGLKDSRQPETVPTLQTVAVKAGVNRVKLIDQQAQREIEIAWNSAELGKLEQNQATPEMIRLAADSAGGEAAPAPLTVVVTHRMPEIRSLAESVHIRQVVVKDAKGFFVNLANDGQYHVKPGEKVRIEVELDNPSKQNMTVEATPRQGQIESNTIYIAPMKPGETDQIKIKVFSPRTGALLDMEIITIKIVDLQ